MVHSYVWAEAGGAATKGECIAALAGSLACRYYYTYMCYALPPVLLEGAGQPAGDSGVRAAQSTRAGAPALLLHADSCVRLALSARQGAARLSRRRTVRDEQRRALSVRGAALSGLVQSAACHPSLAQSARRLDKGAYACHLPGYFCLSLSSHSTSSSSASSPSFHAGVHLVQVPRARCGPAARAALVLAASRSARDVRALRAHLGTLLVLRRAESTLVPLLTVWTEALVHWREYSKSTTQSVSSIAMPT